MHKLWRHLSRTLSRPPDAFPPGYIRPGQTGGWGKVFLNERESSLLQRGGWLMFKENAFLLCWRSLGLTTELESQPIP